MSLIEDSKLEELENYKEKLALELKELQRNRDRIIHYLNKMLHNINLAKELEQAVYKDTLFHTPFNELKMFKCKLFKQRYNYRLMTLILNITEFVEKLKRNEITPDDIFNKNPTYLFPEKWEEVERRKAEEEKFLYTRQLVSNSETAMCYKCREKNVYVTYKQTRSSDEPETIFYRCLTCSNRWKT